MACTIILVQQIETIKIQVISSISTMARRVTMQVYVPNLKKTLTTQKTSNSSNNLYS